MTEQLLAAIQSAYGDSHFITTALPFPSQHCFPAGVKTWTVEHESSTCTHMPRCHWYTQVYEYRGHYTVVKMQDMAYMTLGNLMDRVTRAIEN